MSYLRHASAPQMNPILDCTYAHRVMFLFCGALACLILEMEMLVTPQGACSARKRPAKDGREENHFRAGLSNP